jgi:glutathione S-transferase
MPMKYTTLVMITALVFTFILSGRVGKMRAKLGVDAPLSTGSPQFERAFRIHMNTVEQLVYLSPFYGFQQVF